MLPVGVTVRVSWVRWFAEVTVLQLLLLASTTCNEPMAASNIAVIFVPHAPQHEAALI